MVNRAERDVGARVLQDFIEARITNDEFDSRFPFSRDDAGVQAIRANVWMLYSDLRVHRLTGKYQPNAQVRALLDRCVLFLGTDLEFEWPVPRINVLNIFRGAWLGAKRLLGVAPQEEELWSSYGGDTDLWPFFRKGDYDACIAPRSMSRL
jgi:hypothetical protein